LQENKVVGCVSQVWVVPSLKDDGKVYFEADSDSQLTKGLAALLVEGLSGATPAQILRIQPDFIQLLGLAQKLTASRNNGFLNMLLMMQKKTLALYMEQEKRMKDEGSSSTNSGVAQEGKVAEASGERVEIPNSLNGGGVAPVEESLTASTSGRTSRKEQVHSVNASAARPIYEGMKKKASSI
jgi:hypothetical protein